MTRRRQRGVRGWRAPRQGARLARPHARSCCATGRDARRGFAWIGLLRPDQAELDTWRASSSCPRWRSRTRVHAHQRPKLERYDDVEFVVLRPAWYVDEDEDVQVGEIHLFLGHDFVVTVRHAETPDLSSVRTRLEDDPELLAPGPARGALRGARPRSSTTTARSPRAAQRHRPDRDPGLRRRPERLAAHLPALPRGHRAPARGRPAARRCSTGSSPRPPTTRARGLHRGLRDVADHIAQTSESADNFRQLLGNILRSTPRSSGSARTRRCARSPRPASPRARRSRRSPPGRPSCSPRRSSGRSTA